MDLQLGQIKLSKYKNLDSLSCNSSKRQNLNCSHDCTVLKFCCLDTWFRSALMRLKISNVCAVHLSWLPCCALRIFKFPVNSWALNVKFPSVASSSLLQVGCLFFTFEKFLWGPFACGFMEVIEAASCQIRRTVNVMVRIRNVKHG